MSAEPQPSIDVEVVFSPAPRDARVLALQLAHGATIAAALQATGWPELAAAQEGEAALAAARLSVAIWGHARALATPLRDGDRVEVLRALTIAPMDARRVRHAAAGGVKALRKRLHAAQKR